MQKINNKKIFFKQLLKYINKHWNNDICLKKIAAEKGISLSQVSRIFSNLSGMTIRKYIHEKRTQKFENILKRQKTIKAYRIAKEIGFSSEIQFYKWVKKNTGKTYKELQ